MKSTVLEKEEMSNRAGVLVVQNAEDDLGEEMKTPYIS